MPFLAIESVGDTIHTVLLLRGAPCVLFCYALPGVVIIKILVGECMAFLVSGSALTIGV